MTSRPSTWHCRKSGHVTFNIIDHIHTHRLLCLSQSQQIRSEQQSPVCLPAHLHEVHTEKLSVTQPLQFAPSPDIGLQQVGLILCGHTLQHCTHIICCLEGLGVKLDDCMRNLLPGYPTTCKVCGVSTLLRALGFQPDTLDLFVVVLTILLLSSLLFLCPQTNIIVAN